MKRLILNRKYFRKFSPKMWPDAILINLNICPSVVPAAPSVCLSVVLFVWHFILCLSFWFRCHMADRRPARVCKVPLWMGLSPSFVVATPPWTNASLIWISSITLLATILSIIIHLNKQIVYVFKMHSSSYLLVFLIS